MSKLREMVKRIIKEETSKKEIAAHNDIKRMFKIEDRGVHSIWIKKNGNTDVFGRTDNLTLANNCAKYLQKEYPEAKIWVNSPNDDPF